MGVTGLLAKFAAETTYQRLTTPAVAAAKQAILDSTGVTIAGSLEPSARLVVALVKGMGCIPKAAVVGAGFRTSSPEAALANGVMNHALDYDDMTTIEVRGYPIHPSVPLLPVLLSLGDEVGVPGRDIVTAYVVGYEIETRLGEMMSVDYGSDLGWHPTSPLGTIGAAVAAGKLLNLDRVQMIVAIGLAASQAAGLRQNFGTMIKPFHAGNAARSGVISAMLARDGFDAADDVLEGRYGFCHAFSGGKGYETNRPLDDLGRSFRVVHPGPGLKLYPCCGSTHGALDAMFRLIKKHDISAEEVSEVEVGVPFEPPRSLIHYNPKTGLEGKFSMQYCIAATLVDRNIGLKTFETAQVQRPEVRKFFDKIRMVRQPGTEGQSNWESLEYSVNVKMSSGQTYSEEGIAPLSAVQRKVTEEELEKKYRDCSSLILSARDVEESLELLEHLEELASIRRLAEIIGRSKGD